MASSYLKKMLGIKSDADITPEEKEQARKRLDAMGKDTKSGLKGSRMQMEELSKELKKKK